jgi:hypothetical protein
MDFQQIMEFGDHCRRYDKGWRQQAGAGFIPCQNSTDYHRSDFVRAEGKSADDEPVQL